MKDVEEIYDFMNEIELEEEIETMETKSEKKKRNYKEEVLEKGCHVCKSKELIFQEDGGVHCTECNRTYYEDRFKQRYSLNDF